LNGTNNTWDGTNSSLKSAISSLKGTLTNNTYITTGLTPHNDVTIVAGGYVRVGKVIFINIRLTVTATISAYSVLVNGFPRPVNFSNTNYVAGVTNKKDIATYVNYEGKLQNSDTIGAGDILISAVYIEGT
jgi:hypothetical protein